MSANKPVQRIERDKLVSSMEEEHGMTFIQGIPDNNDDDQPVVKADLRNLESGLTAKIDKVSTELSADITAARSEAKADIAELKGDIGELKADIGELKGDITATRAEAKADIAAARAELKGDIGELKADITTAIAAMSRRVILGVTSMVLVVLVPILVLLLTLGFVPARIESGMQPSLDVRSYTGGVSSGI